jgi:LysR family transcriptional regulator for metE and metH
MNLELRHLHLVQAVVEEGGITPAGSRLGLSQSALSHQLGEIERRLQVALFHRSGKRLILTPAGERVLRAARSVLPELERTELELSQNITEALGTIRLGTECFTCYQWLPAILQRFTGRFPLVEFRLVTQIIENIGQALTSRKVDVAILTQVNRSRHLRLTDLFTEELMVVTAGGHRLAEKQYLRPKDLVGQTLFVASSLVANVLFQRLLRPAAIRLGDLNVIPVIESVLELVKNGFGIAVLGRRSIPSHLPRAEFRVIRLTTRGVFRQWYAASRTSAELPVKSLIEALHLSG